VGGLRALIALSVFAFALAFPARSLAAGGLGLLASTGGSTSGEVSHAVAPASSTVPSGAAQTAAPAPTQTGGTGAAQTAATQTAGTVSKSAGSAANQATTPVSSATTAVTKPARPVVTQIPRATATVLRDVSPVSQVTAPLSHAVGVVTRVTAPVTQAVQTHLTQAAQRVKAAVGPVAQALKPTLRSGASTPPHQLSPLITRRLGSGHRGAPVSTDNSNPQVHGHAAPSGGHPAPWNRFRVATRPSAVLPASAVRWSLRDVFAPETTLTAPARTGLALSLRRFRLAANFASLFAPASSGAGATSAGPAAAGGGGAVVALIFLLILAAVIAGRRLVVTPDLLPRVTFVLLPERPG